jgi:peptidoglycan/xylan/chitin deacetylase (PgdA/CDA1 family)
MEALEAPHLADADAHFLVTFDDGYRETRTLGVPVLQALGIPATFFVSTHNLLSGEPFWFDVVVAAVQTKRLDRLDLRSVGLAEYRFRAVDGAARWSDIQRLLSDLKRIGDVGTPAFDAVLRRFQEDTPSAVPKPLSAADLRAMASTGFCRFGSHGHRHRILPRCRPEVLAGDLATSRHVIESVLGVAATEIAYPNGDVDQPVAEACRAVGFARGFTTRPGVWRLGASGFRIPRLLVGGYDTPSRLGRRVGGLLARRLLAPKRRARRDVEWT